MELIRRAEYEDLERLCKELPYNPTAGLRGIRYGYDKIAEAVVAYDNWTHNSVFMHVWSRSTKPWFDHRFLCECFRYPFEICGKGLVIGCTQGDNAATIKFARHVGFKETHRIKDGWKLGTDLVIQEMRREDCRFLRGDRDGVLQKYS